MSDDAVPELVLEEAQKYASSFGPGGSAAEAGFIAGATWLARLFANNPELMRAILEDK